jgi:hypothetical protein
MKSGHVLHKEIMKLNLFSDDENADWGHDDIFYLYLAGRNEKKSDSFVLCCFFETGSPYIS